jgi:multidrug efflux pump subunit AcrB
MAKIKNTTNRQRVINHAMLGAVVGCLVAILSTFVWMEMSNPLVIIVAFGLSFAILAGIFGDRFWDLFIRLRNLLKWL